MNTKTKTTLIAALLLATTFSLSACGGGSSEPVPAVTVTETAEAPAVVDDTATDTSGAVDEAGLVDAVRSQDSWFENVGASQIIETANSFCTAIRGGMTIEEFGQVAEDTIGQDHAAVLGAGAIVYICPDQKYKIQ